jgi:hypothetical protein
MKKAAAPTVAQLNAAKPFYETWGERRQAEGKYSSVIRYKEHILPIMAAVRKRAGEREALVATMEHVGR